MNALLDGVRVLDLTNVLAGPYCGYQLALLGADVIKIEAPAGDLARKLGASAELSARDMGVSFLAQNAGKRSVVLDFKKPDDKAKFVKLVATADVVLENFRPGVMSRLGLGFDDLKKHKPDIIYCAISGFGQTGPLKGNPAYDQIIQGLSGIMSITGTPETAPLRVGYPVCDTLGGIAGAFAISAALVRRGKTGEGAFLDVSMLESTLSALGWPVSNFLATGVEPKPAGNENVSGAPSGTFRTRDDLLNIAANEQKQFETLCDLIARPELKSDERFAKREARKDNRFALNALIEEALVADSAVSWESRMNAAGVPAGRVLAVSKAISEPQIAARNMTVTFDHVPGADRAVTVVRGGFLVDGEAPRPSRPPPRLGEHEDEIFGNG